MRRHKLLQLFSVSSSMLALIGCADVTGGGSIPSANDPGREARFAFVMHCRDTASGRVVTGNLEYHDQSFAATASNGDAAELRIHAEPVDFPFDGTCADLAAAFPGVAVYSGSYIPQPPDLGPGGTFVLLVQDNGEQGPAKVDGFSVSLTDGIFDGYSNTGTLNRGQIVNHGQR
jgi:hypothetical protein